LHLLSLVPTYRKIEQLPTSPENFEFPSEGKLSPDNRWVIMANLIPWSEEEYAQNFSEEMGAPASAPAKSFNPLGASHLCNEY